MNPPECSSGVTGTQAWAGVTDGIVTTGTCARQRAGGESSARSGHVNGPAEHAGIKVGDVITVVDGKPATSIPVYDLRRTLSHDAPGTVMHFAIKRGTQTCNVAVTLRDQI